MKPLKMALIAAALMVYSQSASAALQVDGFSPSAGWAGTNLDNGTQVSIRGSGFSSVPESNRVFFSDNKEAKVIYAGQSEYEYNSSFGSPGSNVGELDGIGPVAIDSQTGYRYVANKFNRRVEVFDGAGNPIRQIGSDTINVVRGVAVRKNGDLLVSGDLLQNNQIVKGIGVYTKSSNYSLSTIYCIGEFEGNPGDLALDDRDYIYVIDNTLNPNFFSRVIWFDEAGEKIGSFSGIDENWGNMVRIAVDPRAIPISSDRVFYISDSDSKRVIKYDTFVPLLATWSFPDADPLGRVAVDKDGYVYVDLGSKGIVKLDENGQRIGTLLKDLAFTSRPLRTVDANKALYMADTLTGCECIKIYKPSNSFEIVVTVPPGAQTGPLTVKTQQEERKTTQSFTVFQITPVQVSHVEITQGIHTYPFITGKDTLVFIEFNGIFGHPTRDSATVVYTKPGQIGLVENVDYFKYNLSEKKTTAYYHCRIRNDGQYTFKIHASRDQSGNLIPPDKREQSVPVNRTKDIHLYIVRFSDVDNDQWDQKPPFPWFRMDNFLYGLESIKRIFPVDPRNVHWRMGAGKFVDYIGDGIDQKEFGDLLFEAQLLKNQASGKITRIIGLADSALNITQNPRWFGASYKDRIFTPFSGGPVDLSKGTAWGNALSHEIGHTYGLVADSQTNRDKQDKYPHSKNFTLEFEDGGPVRPWNALTGLFVKPKLTKTVMSINVTWDGVTFFENQFDGKPVDYRIVFDQLKTTSHTLSASAYPSVVNPNDQPPQKFVVTGYISDSNTVTIGDSFLTTDPDLPLTPVEPSDYALVQIDETGDEISRDGFTLGYAIPAGETGSPGNGLFDLVRPFAADTARVEIRYKDQVLKTLVPSPQAPALSGVTVNVSEFQPVRIAWEANDPDGDALSFSVLYSDDGGENFWPIVAGLSEKYYVWDDSLSPGSNQAVVRVIASDGFHTASSDSESFGLRKKRPKAAIVSPAEGAVLPQGSLIRMRASGFDPEDGPLPGTAFSWILDDETDLGSGDATTIQFLEQPIPLGTLSVPLAIGPHVIRLHATDSDGMTTIAQVNFQIEADTDRDGFSDSLESDYGGSAYDPYTRPLDLDQDDDGVIVTNEDKNGDGYLDPGETSDLDADTDDDGLNDGLELGLAVPQSDDTDPAAGNFSQDADVTTTTDPTDPDTDDDLLIDGDEDVNGNGMVDFGETDPNNPDSDADGIPDNTDQCQNTPAGEPIDDQGCSISQFCPCQADWKNHGKYVNCVAKTSEAFMEAGFISELEKDRIVMEAAESSCGYK